MPYSSAAHPGTRGAAVDVRPTSPSGLEVWDSTGRVRCRLDLADPSTVRSADPEGFALPVDAAAACRARAVTLPADTPAVVRDADGDFRTTLSSLAFRTFPESAYLVEVRAAIPTYLSFDSGFTVEEDGRTLRFERGAELRVGARSPHGRPETTVTTTDRPADLMAAVSTFGSALRTLSPERSFPAFRDHPPALELGDELAVPEGVDPPWSGIRILLPRRLDYVFAAAPLAYYLGATVEPADRARLVAGGESFSLAAADGVERSLERVLKQTFCLDTVARTAGRSPQKTHERSTLGDALDLDWTRLREADPAERLAAYLSVPFAEVGPHVPTWPVAGHVRPEPSNASALPGLAADLAVVRSPATRATAHTPTQVEAVGDFTRGAAGTEMTFVDPDHPRARTDVWVGDGVPIGATKALPTAEREAPAATSSASDSDTAHAVVVCNDPQMACEHSAVAEAFDGETTLVRDASRAELRDLLRTEADLCHFLGHIDTEGFECADGHLDATSLDAVGMDAFVLNACSSYAQGAALVEAGARGGIVTMNDVVNEGASEFGTAVARLLAGGFSLSAAVELARGESVVGSQYLVVGDGDLTLAPRAEGTPFVLHVTPTEAGYELAIEAFPTEYAGHGSLCRLPGVDADPTVEARVGERWGLNTGTRGPCQLDAPGLDALLDAVSAPVLVGEKQYWSDDVSSADL